MCIQIHICTDVGSKSTRAALANNKHIDGDPWSQQAGEALKVGQSLNTGRSATVGDIDPARPHTHTYIFLSLSLYIYIYDATIIPTGEVKQAKTTVYYTPKKFVMDKDAVIIGHWLSR